ncbi:TadE/TadG family type IV pilus assembly protein [Sphingomonas sp. T9W2]|uniref:TadE/TadG family type IV pilus assembly protein n=1 Tax=Sphingomonas sp. T9W2 TaxID=3143183 RepID=UPI0031F541EF
MIRVRFQEFARARHGVTVIEFALAFPLMIFAILGLLELANIALQRQRLSQAALLIADNAGRLGNMGMSGPEKVTERQINDALLSASVQQSELDLKKRGRVILTSVELNQDGGQWLHWQRCYGSLPHRSSWGIENDGERGKAVLGMGPADNQIAAGVDQPVMFVEIAYKLQPLIFSGLEYASPVIETAAMPIRVERDTTSVVSGSDTQSKCT